jgi:hypothetical protein
MEHLRPRLEELVGRRLGARDWEDLVADDPDVFDEEMWLTDAAETLRRRFAQREELAGTRAIEKEIRPSIEDARYGALAKILAIEASEDPAVEAWRSRYLSDGVVGLEAVREVIGGLRAQEPSEVEALVRVPRMEAALRGKVVEGELIEPRRRTVRYVSADGSIVSFEVAANGPLGELAGIAERLASSYHWIVSEATSFVVTGRVPTFDPLVIRVRATDRAATSRVMIDVDPRTPRAEVAKAYDTARNDPLLAELVGVGSSRSLTKERPIALAVFLARHQDESWRTMLQGWNESHPQWRYRDERAFAAAASLAWQRVVGVEFSKATRERRVADQRASALLGLPIGSLPPFFEEEETAP